MIPPTIAVLGLGGSRRWVPLPIPLVLAWPLVAVALGITAICQRIAGVHPGQAVGVARAILVALCHMSGLTVDVLTARGWRYRLWVL